MDHCFVMTAGNFLAHFFGKANGCQVTADLPGRVIENA
jgi:hypothetical protein